ncbi:MAG: helix-turn-helix domain-containing protein [Thiobacillus sp.]|nr:helix-turn-helix domain-containing protein [Thiobacillus sp.]
MSIRVMTKVWDCPHVGGGSELLALLALADWSDDEGRCWPSMESIARKIRLSEKQARRIVHALIDAGLIEVIGNHQGGRRGRDGDGFSRQYRIVIERLSTLPAPPAGVLLPSHGCPSTLPPVSFYPPMGGRQPVIEPSIEPSVKQCADGAPPRLPDGLDRDLWEGYLDHYHELQAMKGNPEPHRNWEGVAIRKLNKLASEGNDPNLVVEQAIYSRDGLLLPLPRAFRKEKSVFTSMDAATTIPATSGQPHGHTGHPSH